MRRYVTHWTRKKDGMNVCRMHDGAILDLTTDRSKVSCRVCLKIIGKLTPERSDTTERNGDE
jgi:hypothetical protein